MDLIYVSYNSEEWIDDCFRSIIESDHDLSKLNIIVVDNSSTDETIQLLYKFKDLYGNLFESFIIICNSQNLGFGVANNIGFENGQSEIVCFFNIDTILMKDTLSQLEKEISESDNKIALWELRQAPYEHPKIYDTFTGEVSWASGAAFAVRRKIYEEIGGFDSKIFMYVEDVDLSWRIRSLGYKLKYVPKVKIIHYSYKNGNQLKLNQHVYGVINSLLLRYRYGTIKNILVGHIMFWNLLIKKEMVPGAKKMLLEQYFNHFSKILHFYDHGRFHNKNIKPYFEGVDYERNRLGAFYEIKMPEITPLVSIIVRTCGRPEVLREALLSIRNQTYKNIEVVVVEDGLNVSNKIIENEFADLNLIYFSTQIKVGRSKAGNLAMEKAKGKYFNFLDDDDAFFADHVETLVCELERENVKELAAYSIGLETAIKVESKDPYRYKVMEWKTVHVQSFDKVILCHHNYIPIQCIMFNRCLFERFGGLDENVDALEDWDLWVRYSLASDFIFVNKTTSIYRIPYDKHINDVRQKALDESLLTMRNKHQNYIQTLSVREIALLYEK